MDVIFIFNNNWCSIIKRQTHYDLPYHLSTFDRDCSSISRKLLHSLTKLKSNRDLYARGATFHPNNIEGGTELNEKGKLDGATSTIFLALIELKLRGDGLGTRIPFVPRTWAVIRNLRRLKHWKSIPCN